MAWKDELVVKPATTPTHKVELAEDDLTFTPEEVNEIGWGLRRQRLENKEATYIHGYSRSRVKEILDFACRNMKTNDSVRFQEVIDLYMEVAKPDVLTPELAKEKEITRVPLAEVERVIMRNKCNGKCRGTTGESEMAGCADIDRLLDGLLSAIREIPTK